MRRSVVVEASAPAWAHELGRDINSALRGISRAVNGIPLLPSYTVGALPPATTPGLIIYVTDEAGGAVSAVADGTNWRRQTDRAVVS